MLLANGVTSTYTYNSLNRLTDLTATKGSTIASFAYVLGTAGNRLRVTEANGRMANYSYDSLYRLTERDHHRRCGHQWSDYLRL